MLLHRPSSPPPPLHSAAQLLGSPQFSVSPSPHAAIGVIALDLANLPVNVTQPCVLFAQGVDHDRRQPIRQSPQCAGDISLDPSSSLRHHLAVLREQSPQAIALRG